MLRQNKFSKKKIATQTSINIITFGMYEQRGNLIRYIPSFSFGCNIWKKHKSEYSHVYISDPGGRAV